MEIEYTGRQIVINKKLKAQAEAGLAQIAKLVGRTASAHVILTTEKYRQIAEVTLKTRKHSLVARCEGTEMEAAMHDALAKLEQQTIRHNKKKATEKRHPKAGSAAIKGAAADAEVEADEMPAAAKGSKSGRSSKNGAGAMVVRSSESEPHIVRSIDSAAMRPMSLEEAVKEAALKDRDVFVFRDRRSQVIVLHRMRDGRVELIQVP